MEAWSPRPRTNSAGQWQTAWVDQVRYPQADGRLEQLITPPLWGYELPSSHRCIHLIGGVKMLCRPRRHPQPYPWPPVPTLDPEPMAGDDSHIAGDSSLTPPPSPRAVDAPASAWLAQAARLPPQIHGSPCPDWGRPPHPSSPGGSRHNEFPPSCIPPPVSGGCARCRTRHPAYRRAELPDFDMGGWSPTQPAPPFQASESIACAESACRPPIPGGRLVKGVSPQ